MADLSGYSNEQLLAMLHQPPPASPSPNPGSLVGGIRALARGVPIVGPFLDEADAATGAALDKVVPQSIKSILGLDSLKGSSFGEKYDDALAQQRGMDRSFDKAHPIASPALQTTGAVAGTLAGLRGAPSIARPALGLVDGSLLPRLAAAGASGAAIGGITGFGDAEGGLPQRLSGAESGATIGGGIGVALPALGSGAGKLTGAFFDPAQAAPTIAELRNHADALYKQIDQSGLRISGPSFKTAMNGVASAAQEAGIDPTLHPGATAVLKRLTDAGGEDLTLKQAETLRRVVNGAAGSNSADERRIVRTIRDGFDDYMQNLGPSELASEGSDPQALEKLAIARDLWSRQAKASVVDGMMERAKNRAGQYPILRLGDSLRTEFRNLAQNPARMRQFSSDEQDAIRQVAQGGNAQNVLHLIGRLAPTSIVGGGAGIGLGHMIGGPAGAAGLSAVGLGAKMASRQMTMADVAAASDLMRRGGPKDASQLATQIAPIAQGILGGVVPSTVTGGILDPEYAYR